MRDPVFKLCTFIRDKLDLALRPESRMLVSSLVANFTNLEMSKEERTLLAPSFGTYGPFVLSGTFLPVIEYQLFDKGILQFVRVRVELSLPDKIRFITIILSQAAPELHGKEIETKEEHKVPFHRLAMQLFRYFPAVRENKIKVS